MKGILTLNKFKEGKQKYLVASIFIWANDPLKVTWEWKNQY